ncbi:MAG: beta-galactosidase, partial [Verrucomicrobia bacterium]|nr:beta-galactosidase [Verrucomicrobiota bacterium]
MDANQTRFHLVFGQDDWLGPARAVAASQPVEWDTASGTLALLRKTFLFPAIPGDRLLGPADRRGAGQDRYGNYYWIGPNEDEILFLGIGATAPEHFWSAKDELPTGVPSGGAQFNPLTPAVAGKLQMRGLAVTSDHYLAVGLADPKGLLIFDLYAGGSPLEYHWPDDVPLAPFDLAPAPDNGLWILDRDNRQYWGLDSLFRVLAPHPASSAGSVREAFQPVDGPVGYQAPCTTAAVVTAQMAMPVAALAPVSIEALPDGSVLILDNPPLSAYSLVYHYRLGLQVGNPVALDKIDVEPQAIDPKPYPLLGQDLAFVPDPQSSASSGVSGVLYVADSSGNQTFAFDFAANDPAFPHQLVPQFFPMRRFGGKALFSGGAGVSYDFEDRWAILTAQPKPRFETQALLMLPAPSATDPAPAFDGKQPGCVWHRLFVDACIPPGAQVVIERRAADEKTSLSATLWQLEPPLYLRDDGPEIPYYVPQLGGPAGQAGTWELLFQNAQGRYLQLRLTLRGTGRNTPRLQSLRVYYPRFSYLNQYLPAVYRDDPTSASFLDRYLANSEGFFTVIEGRIQQAQELFDPQTVPAQYLEWLGSWLGASFDLAWTEPVKRFFLAHAPQFFRARGTVEGVTQMIRLTLDSCTDESLFEPSSAQRFSVRLVEQYLKRQAPGVVFGDPTDVAGPGSTTPELDWTPAQGAGPLDQRYRDFLRAKYLTIDQLNQAWGLGPGQGYASFNDARLRLPAIQPAGNAQAADWTYFLQYQLGFVYEPVGASDLPLYQDFLTRRYGDPKSLNNAYGLTGLSALASFDEVAAKLWNAQLGMSLPASGVMLQDWILFVSVVAPATRYAHRFTVLVPVQLDDDLPTQESRKATASRIA